MKNNKITRKEFLKTSAFLGSVGLIATQSKKAGNILKGLSKAAAKGEDFVYPLSLPENVINTVCLQCNTGCGIKVKLLNGLAVKIDGNPYSPWAMTPHLSLDSSVYDTAPIDGVACLKGQSGIQTLYDPYRIVKVLKRKGPRGSNQWETIDFNKAVEEIVNGGKLFSDVKGEENRQVEGLGKIRALTDPAIAKEMASDIKKLKDEIKKLRKEEITEDDFKKKLDEFKAKYKDNLHTLIDPNHPDLGPKNNQLLVFWGRQKSGRGAFLQRFCEAFGTTNRIGHTTVCQGSLYFAGKVVQDQFYFDEKDKIAKWGGGAKSYWQTDASNVKFVLAVGSALIEGGYGPTPNAEKLMGNYANGKVKFAVIDPRLSKIASKAEKWIPIKPGTEGAFAMGMIKWILENNRFNESYLKNANKGSAIEDKEPTWTTAPWLVKIKDGKPGKFLRGSDIDVSAIKKTAKDSKTGEDISYDIDPFVVLKGNQLVTFDPNDEEISTEGDLFANTEVNDIKVKSSLQIMKEEASKETIDGWAKICGVDPGDIAWCAEEFTSYGRQATADIHRGVSQHTNGFYNVFAWMCVNFLIGNVDYKGGYIIGKAFDATGKKEGQPYDVIGLLPEKISPFGISIIRHEVKYEETTLFEGYPAKRPWFPFVSDIYQEITPSIEEGYPYPIKAAIMYCAAPTYSLPAAHKTIELFRNLEKLPLFVAVDIIIGNTSVYADYIFPDISYLERFDYFGTQWSIPAKAGPFFQPAVAPLTETVKVFGKEMPLSYEAMLLALAEKLELSGFGKNGFKEGMDLNHPDDFYLKLAANVAFGEKKDGSEALQDADGKELKLFADARKHLPKIVFDMERWEKAAGSEHWKRVVYLLNRGGRFTDHADLYDGEYIKAVKYGKQLNMYIERVAEAKNPMTGKSFYGYPTYLEILDSLGRPIDDEKDGYNLHLITHKEITQTKTRTMSNYWLLGVLPENYILINSKTAEELGLKDGSSVKVVSATNPDGEWDLGFEKKPMIGKIKIIEGIKPGVISFCLGFGHWAYGSREIVIDGKKFPVDVRRGKGIHANAAMRTDPHLKNTSLQDLVGGSVSFYDTFVKLVKV